MLRTCRRAMADDGKLIILDRVMPERIEPDQAVLENALMDLMMLVRTPGGRSVPPGNFLLSGWRWPALQRITLGHF